MSGTLPAMAGRSSAAPHLRVPTRPAGLPRKGLRVLTDETQSDAEVAFAAAVPRRGRPISAAIEFDVPAVFWGAALVERLRLLGTFECYVTITCKVSSSGISLPLHRMSAEIISRLAALGMLNSSKISEIRSRQDKAVPAGMV